MESIKGKIKGYLTALLIIVLLCCGFMSELIRFMAWLFELKYTQPETSVPGGIVVRALTFAVSFGLVWLIFNVLGLFNKYLMKFCYFVVSIIVGFAIAYVVWKIEQYILIIGIIFGIIALIMAVVIFISAINYFKNKKNDYAR